MADRNDLEFTYSLIDRVFRLSMGEQADFSGAMYDGDFSLTLEEAQTRKHDYIVERLAIGPGRRMLDLGCGWGPLLDVVRRRDARGVGVTLSSAQLAACRRNGLDVHLFDGRLLTPETFGPFDAVASLGAFEHFCSPEQYRAGQQESGYRDVFAHVASVLPDTGRFYLQTMVFGRNMIPLDDVDIDAPASPTRGTSHSWAASSPVRGSRWDWNRSSSAPSRTSALCRARTGGSTTSRPSASGESGSRRRASGNHC